MSTTEEQTTTTTTKKKVQVPEDIDYDKCNVEKPLKNNKLDLMEYVKD